MKKIRTINLSGLEKGKVLDPSEMKNVTGGSTIEMCCYPDILYGIVCRPENHCGALSSGCSGWCEYW